MDWKKATDQYNKVRNESLLEEEKNRKERVKKIEAIRRSLQDFLDGRTGQQAQRFLKASDRSICILGGYGFGGHGFGFYVGGRGVSPTTEQLAGAIFMADPKNICRGELPRQVWEDPGMLVNWIIAEVNKIAAEAPGG